MTRRDKITRRVLSGDAAVRFDELLIVAEWLGFRHSRTRGSHVVMVHERIGIILVLQADGPVAKRYQVEQLRVLVRRYNLDG